MDTIQIPCPQCGRELKLRDRSLLGRKGKCPKCGFAFVLEEPTAPIRTAKASPLAETAVWAPESRNPTVTAARPSTGWPQTSEPVAEAGLAEFSFGANDGAAARLKALQKKNARRRNVGLAVGAVVLSAVGGMTYMAINHGPQKPAPEELEAANGQAAVLQPSEDASEEVGNATSPTKGKPIELQYIPFGTQVMLNIHPAQLWGNESRFEEFRTCLPHLAKLLENRFQELFKRKPEQIEEAQICLIPGTQGTLPDIAAVIHLVEEAKKSQLLEDIGGQRIEDFGHPVYITGEAAYMILDQKTIAMGPKDQAQEMVNAIAGRNSASNGIDELLPMTDRDRHVTLMFVPRTIRQHSPWWFPDVLRPFVLQSLDWFGDEVETVCWSFHLGEKAFYSDLHLRNVTGINASRLERDIHEKFDRLPQELLTTIRMMNPTAAGKRKVIGRVPKMSEVVAMASTYSRGARHVQVVASLPERAAPNLALGTLLAWDESTRTDFKKSKSTGPASGEVKVPDLLVDRLKMKFDAEFNRSPLQDVFAFIANEVKTTIDIDGDALKAGGFTKNMPQTFKLDKAPAQDVIAEVLKRYQDPAKPGNTMVLVIDENSKKFLITTLAFAEQKKQKIFDIFKK